MDVVPRLVVEFVALQQEGEGVGAGCTGVTEVGPVRSGELLLQLLPIPGAEFPDSVID